MLPAIACEICSSDGCGVFASRATAAMICPLWQYPHCGTCSAIHACCTACRPFEDKPSIVVMFLPVTCETGVEQERTGSPTTWTVMAEFGTGPQPNLAPLT